MDEVTRFTARDAEASWSSRHGHRGGVRGIVFMSCRGDGYYNCTSIRPVVILVVFYGKRGEKRKKAGLKAGLINNITNKDF